MPKIFLPSKQELVELYVNRELSISDIGDKYGISSAKVRKLCKLNDISLRSTNWRENRIVTADGHLVRSIYESLVDHWFVENNISHEYEPKVFKRIRADFFALNHYIEIWGVKRSKAYKTQKARKLEIYRENNLPLIELSWADFQATTWKEKLSSLKTAIL
jgi:predicted DNA-binding protein YlxM (UPF0122 family)